MVSSLEEEVSERWINGGAHVVVFFSRSPPLIRQPCWRLLGHWAASAARLLLLQLRSVKPELQSTDNCAAVQEDETAWPPSVFLLHDGGKVKMFMVNIYISQLQCCCANFQKCSFAILKTKTYHHPLWGFKG